MSSLSPLIFADPVRRLRVFLPWAWKARYLVAWTSELPCFKRVYIIRARAGCCKCILHNSWFVMLVHARIRHKLPSLSWLREVPRVAFAGAHILFAFVGFHHRAPSWLRRIAASDNMCAIRPRLRIP
jgi:hypothetical protein